MAKSPASSTASFVVGFDSEWVVKDGKRQMLSYQFFLLMPSEARLRPNQIRILMNSPHVSPPSRPRLAMSRILERKGREGCAERN